MTDLTGAKLTAQVLDMHAHPEASRTKVKAAMDRVNGIYREVFTRIAETLYV